MSKTMTGHTKGELKAIFEDLDQADANRKLDEAAEVLRAVAYFSDEAFQLHERLTQPSFRQRVDQAMGRGKAHDFGQLGDFRPAGAELKVMVQR